MVLLYTKTSKDNMFSMRETPISPLLAGFFLPLIPC